MTPSASGSAPPQWPSQAEAASGRSERGEALLAGIGNTPPLPLDAVLRDLPNQQLGDVRLLGKAEWCNPGRSLQDRAAARIVAGARRSGQITSGEKPIDSTHGH